MMCCTPSISIVAQSLCKAVILPPEMRHSSWTSPKRTRASGGLTSTKLWAIFLFWLQ